MSISESDNTEELLQRIFGSVTLDDFFANYWEQKPLHISRNDEKHYSSYVSKAAIESLIVDTAVYFPRVQLSGGAEGLIPEHYLDDQNKVLPTRFLQAHAAGSTIVISQAHDVFAPLAHLKRTMQSALELQCQTNVYLSPIGKRGFNPHYDAHDVVILQVSGCKTFRFYPGGPVLPFANDRFDSERDKPGTESQSVRLEPGDTLYIPRGMMHDAVADGAEHSLHITLGVYAVTWLDMLQVLLQQRTCEFRKLRQSIPREHWVGNSEPTSLVREASELLKDLTPTQLQQAMDSLRDDIALGSSPSSEGILERLASDTENLGDNAEQILQLLPGRVINLTRDPSRLILRCHGQILEFKEPVATAVERLLDKKKIRVGELAGLDADQRHALVVQLVSENLIELL